jgi:hypothetical protein
MGFNVSFVDGTQAPINTPSHLRFTPTRWSALALGGYNEATIRVTGARVALWELSHWLRYGVTIRSEGGAVVWDGYIHEVQISIGAINVGLSLDSMYNAVNVLYAYTGGDGERSAETGWTTDSDSIQRFGRKDLLHSDSDVLPSMATDVQTRLLADHKAAIPTVATTGGSGGEDSVLLLCRGWWHTLDWRYYSDESGVLSYEKTDTPITIGWSLTASNLAFVGAPINRVADMSGRLEDLFDGDMFDTSGATNSGNNQIHTITETAGTQLATYVGTWISFVANDEILDAGGGLGFSEQYGVVQVSGSTSGLNDGYCVVGDGSANRIETTSGFGMVPIVDQAAGPTVTISQGNNVKVTTALTNEIPGAAVTLTSPSKACQSFTLSAAWLVGEITLYVGRVGSPSDNAKCELCANSAGNPGTVLGTSVIPGSDVEEGGAWLSFHFDPPVSLAASTLYWIVFSRSGAAAAADYYTIAGSDDADYTDGSNGLYMDGAWVARTTGVDLGFQVWEVVETTEMIGDIVASLSGAFVATDVVTTSGTYTKRNRADRVTAREEIENLLDQGTSGNKRITANVLPGRTIVLDVEAIPNVTTDLILRDNGNLYHTGGQKLLPGVLPVRKWVRIADVPATGAYASISPFYVDQIEYDAENAAWQITPKGNDDEFDVATMQG